MLMRDEREEAEFANGRNHLFKDELLEVMETARDTSIRDHAIFLVCYLHSLRASEVSNLRLEDLRWSDMTLHVARVKGSMETVQSLFAAKGIPALDEIRTLKLWRKERPEDFGGYLFNSQKSVKFHPDSLTRLFARYCQQVSKSRIRRGLRPIPENLWHLHTLRHSRITHLITKMNPFAVKQIAGHKNISSTMIYAAPNQRDACQQAQRLTLEEFT
jgi:integrase